MSEYWDECIEIALEEAGIKATREQIEEIAESVEVAYENYSMAHGYDAIPNPVEYEAQRKLREIEDRERKREEWELSTNPCKSCTTTGWVKDGWGRDVVCMNCNGKGRV